MVTLPRPPSNGFRSQYCCAIKGKYIGGKGGGGGGREINYKEKTFVAYIHL